MTGREGLRFRPVWPDSLTVRVPLALVLVQAGCVVLALLAFPLLAPFTNYETIADTTARRLIEGSLVRGADGAVRIQPTPELRAYAQRRPELGYAALDGDGTVMPGSMPEMTTLLLRLNPALPRVGGNFEIDQPGRLGGTAFVTTDMTRIGVITFATTGNVFRIDDVPSFMAVFLPAILPA